MRHTLGAKGREHALAVWDRGAILGRIEDKLLELCNGVTKAHTAPDTVEAADLQSAHNQVS